MRTTLVILFLVSFSAAAIQLDEAPGGPGEWGFRPADESTAVLNPPGFTWRPTEGAKSYDFQLAADPAFEHIIYERSDTPWSAHCPSKSLGAGTYYWRYRAKDESGAVSAWSTVRSVTIPKEAVVFPQPTLSTLVERMPEEHPRLFFRAEDIAGFRVAAAGPLADRWKELRAEADALLANPPDTTEPPLYPEGITIKGEEWKKIWWGNRERTIAVLDGAASLAFVYRISGEERYGKAARDLLMAFAEWDPNGSTNYRYNDEAGMPSLYFASRAYSWAYPLLSDADRRAVTAVMRIRGQHAFDGLRRRSHLWRPYSSHHNRSWHFFGELAIAFQGEFPEADTWLDYTMTIFYTAYPVWNDSDGGWHEGTGYWASYLTRFMYWADVMRSAFDIDVFRRPFFHKTGYFGLYAIPPGSETGGFGNMGPWRTSKNTGPVMALLAAGSGNAHWKWYADKAGADLGRGYLGFMRAARAKDVPSRPPTELPASICFPGVGIAILNTDLLDGSMNIQVFFKSSPMGRQSHGYNANNAFLLNLRGHPVLLRSGRREIHGSPHHSEWMWHSRSDNAILVNGEGQIKQDVSARGRILEFETSPRVDIVAGEAGDSYKNLDRWTRRLIFFKPWAVLIHDVLEAPEPSTFQWTLHAPGPFEIEGSDVGWSGDVGSVKVSFLQPELLDITQTDKFEPPPHPWAEFELSQWHLTAETTEKAAQRTFTTLILIDGAEVSHDFEVEGGDTLKQQRASMRLQLPDGNEATATFEFDRFSVMGPGFNRTFGY